MAPSKSVTGIWTKSANHVALNGLKTRASIKTHILNVRQRGFTLLEMMLTVALIGLMAGFIVVNFNQTDQKLAGLEAKRFVALVNLAQEESIMTGQPIKLSVDVAAHSYQFITLDPESQSGFGLDDLALETDIIEDDDQAGEKAEKDSFMRPRVIPEVVQMTFIRKPSDKKKNKKASKFTPDRVHEILNESILDKASEVFDDEQSDAVVIEPNGLISPFVLTLSVEDKVVTVALDRFGKAGIVKANE
ncbi:MAG: type II secretion system minor pseudopilin GspH [Arenicellales bacterium]